MLWYKEWANSDSHPKIVAAGFWGATVFRALCRTSAEFDLNGRIPPQYMTEAYLAHRLQLAPEFDSLDPDDATPATVVQRGLGSAVAAGLLVRDGSVFVIDGWGERQTSATGGGKSNTERSRAFRSRQKEPATAPQRPATDATPATVEKRRVEKKEDPAGAVAPPPAKKASPPADSRHARAIAAFKARFEAAHPGSTWRYSDADGPALKRVLAFQEATEHELAARMDFAFRDAWFRQNGTLAVFCSKWATWTPAKPARAAYEGIPSFDEAPKPAAPARRAACAEPGCKGLCFVDAIKGPSKWCVDHHLQHTEAA